jgi:hypothetical protein
MRKRPMAACALVLSLLATFFVAQTPAWAGSCTQRDETHTDYAGTSWSTVWYCGNDSGAAVYADADGEALVGWMDTTTSWFVCYRRGQQHAGGNDVWYYTQGDRSAPGYEGRQAWGLVPAVSLTTSTDPFEGIPPCDDPGSGTSPAPPRPDTDHSYYVTEFDLSQARRFGCEQADLDIDHSAQETRSSVAILDFGGQNSQGTGTLLTFTGRATTNAEIAEYTQQYARGYHDCVSARGAKNSTTVAIGTNNDLFVNVGTGRAWAGVVETVEAWRARQSAGLRAAVSVIGADDIEPGFSPVSNARAWVRGYLGATDRSLLNFGSADGCPTELSVDTTVDRTCHNGWTWEDLWQLSGGSARILTVPEVYYATQARQWALVARYGESVHGSRSGYHGVLTQYPLAPGTNTARAAWEQLRDALDGRLGPVHSMEICRSDLAAAGRCTWS